MERSEFQDAAHQLQMQAQELWAKGVSWVEFFKTILGSGGLVRETFKDPTDLRAFWETDEHKSIQTMLCDLRTKEAAELRPPREPTRVITVRLPMSMHESLRAEAHDHHISMNKLCISKLLQPADEKLVPAGQID